MTKGVRHFSDGLLDIGEVVYGLLVYCPGDDTFLVVVVLSKV